MEGFYYLVRLGLRQSGEIIDPWQLIRGLSFFQADSGKEHGKEVGEKQTCFLLYPFSIVSKNIFLFIVFQTQQRCGDNRVENGIFKQCVKNNIFFVSVTDCVCEEL